MLIHVAAGVKMKEGRARRTLLYHTLEKVLKTKLGSKEQIHPQPKPQWDDRGRVSEVFSVMHPLLPYLSPLLPLPPHPSSYWSRFALLVFRLM